MRHIPEDELHAYLDQGLSRSQCVEIESHLAACASCQARPGRHRRPAGPHHRPAGPARAAALLPYPVRDAAPPCRLRGLGPAAAGSPGCLGSKHRGRGGLRLDRQSPHESGCRLAWPPASPAVHAGSRCSAGRRPKTPGLRPRLPRSLRPTATDSTRVRAPRRPPQVSRALGLCRTHSRPSGSDRHCRTGAGAFLDRHPAGRARVRAGRHVAHDVLGGRPGRGRRQAAAHRRSARWYRCRSRPASRVRQPLMVVAQQLSSGEVIRTIEGPATDVSHLLARRTMSDPGTRRVVGRLQPPRRPASHGARRRHHGHAARRPDDRDHRCAASRQPAGDDPEVECGDAEQVESVSGS